MIKVDISGAKQKTGQLLELTQAAKYQLTEFSKDAVFDLKQSAANMKKTPHKTGQLARSIGFRLSAEGAGWKATIGTGLGNVQDVKYARILDQGGPIVPKKRKFLTVPFPGVQGVAANYPDAFVLKTVTGALLLVNPMKRGWKPLFWLTKRVEMPAFRWFSDPWEAKVRELDSKYLSKSALLQRAAQLLSGGSRAR